MAKRLAVRTRPRTALVLGAGGVLGAAWMTGALPAVQERLSRPVGDVDLMLGTSAGSVLTAALRCGVSIEEMIAFQRGEPIGALAEVGDVHGGAWPRPPRLRFGSPRLMASALMAPHRIHPSVGASAWLPVGRENHHNLRAMVHLLHTQATALHFGPHHDPDARDREGPHHGSGEHHGWSLRHGPGGQQAGLAYGAALTGAALPGGAVPGAPVPPPAPAPEGGPHWIDRGQTWVVAVDYESGERVVFGREGAPRARLADAVVASCSVPGWFEPFVIGGRRYVDGGVRSATSLGLLARTGVQEVWVLAPMASVVADRPREPHKRLERRVRALLTFALLREVRALRAAGVEVTVLTPGPEDLAVMGVNLMDPRRRAAVLETSLGTSPRSLDSRAA